MSEIVAGGTAMLLDVAADFPSVYKEQVHVTSDDLAEWTTIENAARQKAKRRSVFDESEVVGMDVTTDVEQF